MLLQTDIDNKYIKDSGCYFMSLLYNTLSKEDFTECNILKIYSAALENNFIDKDCFVKEPTKLLEMFTNKIWNVRASGTIDKESDFVIACYYNPRTNYHHFVAIDKNGNVIYDPLGESITVKEGYQESYRNYYCRRI